MVVGNLNMVNNADRANTVRAPWIREKTGNLTAVSDGEALLVFPGTVDISIFGNASFVGTAAIERSFDGPASGFREVDNATADTQLGLTTGSSQYVRISCTAYTSGTIGYRIRQGVDREMHG